MCPKFLGNNHEGTFLKQQSREGLKLVRFCEGLLVQVASLQDKPKFEDGEKNDDDEAEKENKENQQENKQDKHEEKAEKPKKDKQDKHKPTKAEKLAKQASAEVVTEYPWMMSKLQKNSNNLSEVQRSFPWKEKPQAEKQPAKKRKA